MSKDTNFSEETILDYIATNVMDHETEEGYLDDVFDDLFNSDFWIIGRFEATTALNNFNGYEHGTELDGVFGAIEFVQTYEAREFGAAHPEDISDPERLANMVAYIMGENAFNEILDKTGLNMDDMASRKNLEKIKKEAFKMMKEGRN